MCIAQLHPSVCRGVYGLWTVGVLLWSAGGFDELPYHCLRWLCSFVTVFGTEMPSPS